MSRPNFDALFDEIHERVQSGMNIGTAETVNYIRDSLSDPYPPSSKGGESPHLRTGALRDGVVGDVTASEDEIVSTISSSRVEGNPNVPVYLEFGKWTPHGSKSPQPERPYMRPGKQVASVIFPATVAAEINRR